MTNDDRSSNDSGKRTWIERLGQIFSSTPKSRQDIHDIVLQAKEESLLDSDELTLIQGAMAVTDIHVREVMVPRSQMVVVHADESPAEFLPNVIKSGHSRFPVVGETSDDIIGILHAKDLLPLVIEKDLKDFDLSQYLRPIHKVPESQRLNNLLKDFRETRKHMAIVFDEYGGVSGIITIEDVLEEIVGEIEDEFDALDNEFIKALSDNEYIVKAITTIEDFNSKFNASLDESEFDTIAGLITKKAGRVSQRGEVVDIDQFSFKILNADKRRLLLLRLTVNET